ncbi:recombinase family protein [uncultured Duncaniella sp.]|uniref:recombinase family protein n=1 Tax=uncultured Duncaniella sp. TaxID=2768039 RepID=UPI002658C82B|nr:recombinase family protein [uncultured Duncaniella sp.]
MRRAAVYIRVSTQEQAQEGYSVGEQKERLIAYCKAQDWLIADIYVDGGYTGSNLNRPGIQKLMAETDKFDVVLVYKLDRLSRSQRDTLYLIEEIFLPNNVDFVSMQESFDTSSPFGKAMIGLLAVFAQLEREQIKERTKMGRIARAKAGLYHGGGYIPIGYDYDHDAGKLVINPYEAEQVRKIFEWYLSGGSLKSITDRLQDEGFTNKYGSYSSWSSVRYILENETYLGRIHFGDVLVEHAHEAIVSEEQFNAVQVLRGKRREQYGATAFQSKHWLTGLIFCGNCGGRYYLRNSGKYSYYACYSRTKQIKSMVKDPNCKNKNWKGPELEAKIDARIRELLHSPEMAADIAAHKPQAAAPVAENSSVEKRIREIDKQISKLMSLYQNDEIPTELLGEQISRLYNEKTTLQAAVTPVVEPTAMPFDLVQELIADAAQIWDFADEAQRRRIAQSLISRIILTDDEIEIEWAF